MIKVVGLKKMWQYALLEVWSLLPNTSPAASDFHERRT